jgi:hypothetical protein
MKNINQYKNRFNQLLESTMGNVKPLIMEQETGNTITFEVITNNWSKLPNDFNGYLVFPNLITLRPHLIPNGEQLLNYYNSNKDNLTADGYVCYLNNNVMYLIPVTIDNGQVGSGECSVEKGTTEEFNNFYGNGKSPDYNQLPQGSTEYMIIKKNNDINYSLLGVLKGGSFCWTHLFKNLTDKYKHLSKCWTS